MDRGRDPGGPGRWLAPAAAIDADDLAMAWPHVPATSIDYRVLEEADNLVVDAPGRTVLTLGLSDLV